MIGCLNQIKSYFIKFFCGVFICFSPLYAGSGSPDVKIDGYDQIVVVWHEVDVSTSLLKILATYGNSNPSIVNLTDPADFHAYSPILVTSRSDSSSFTAVAIWKAWDVTSSEQVIQAAVATSSGWTTNSGLTISDAANEVPQNEYKIDISDNGLIIVVTWTSYLLSEEDFVARKAYSIDGGVNWSDPVTLGDVIEAKVRSAEERSKAKEEKAKLKA